MSGTAEPQQTPPLPRQITDRLRDLTLQRDTLLYVMGGFGDDFSRDRFVAAATSNDPAERAKVLAVERGFEILTNYLTELTVAGLEAAGYRTRGAKVVAPQEFRLLQSKGGISADLCRRLIELNRTRNDLQHDYPTVQARTLHAAVSELVNQFAAFMRAYPSWLRENLPR